MMVSFIQSNYMGFGSGVVVPGYGVSLQNRGHAFARPRRAPANVVAPGKRPFHTIIPAFLTRDGEPVMSFGVMGANMQPQGHLQTLVRMLDHGQHPQACDAPLALQRWPRDQRRGGMDPATVQGWPTSATASRVIADSYPGLRRRALHLAPRRPGRSRATSRRATRGATARLSSGSAASARRRR